MLNFKTALLSSAGSQEMSMYRELTVTLRADSHTNLQMANCLMMGFRMGLIWDHAQMDMR